jgi:hypothetical protein
VEFIAMTIIKIEIDTDPCGRPQITQSGPAPVVTPTIGILSSIHYSGAMQTSFLAGLNMPAHFNILEDKGYGQDLRDAAVTLEGSGANLIVTFGGLVACDAAKHAGGSIKFISLIGGLPSGFIPPVDGNFVGCCSLQSFTHDGPRITWLVNNAKAANAQNVGLLYNSHSVMGPVEASPPNWTGGAVVDAVNGWTDPANFPRDFAGFPGNIQAIVISADAYFHKHKDALISAANGSGKYICYPLLTYRNTNGSVQPTHGNAVIIGPDLHGVNPIDPQSAYYQMGVMAATVLRGANPNPAIVAIAQAPPVQL